MSIYDYYCKAYKVSTDSRHIEPDAVFFALKGANFDGNDFALEVAEQGVACLVVADRPSLSDHPRLVKVSNSLQALQGLALFHRLLMKDLRVLAITGTNGKTTTKELVSAVLSRKFKLVHTQGNFNNHIGVPLTLLSITPDTEMAVVEMGANHPGEIATLTKIANPDYGIITNIGKAHLEGFGGFEGVIKTKNELYNYLYDNHKTAFVNHDNPLLMGLIGSLDHYTYGTSEADCVVTPKACDPYLSVFNDKTGEIQTQLAGAYNLENVAAAIAVGQYFGVPSEDIHEAITSYRPNNSRSQIIDGRNHIIMDAYNANPTSMNAAIMNFHAICGQQALPILGDMLELGTASESEHRAILALLQKLGFHKAFLVGSCFCQYNDNPEYMTFPSAEALADYLEKHPVSHQDILVKGSRGIRLEQILPLIQ